MFPRMLLVVVLVGVTWSGPAMAGFMTGNQLYESCTHEEGPGGHCQSKIPNTSRGR
jgi:hypothetical protein